MKILNKDEIENQYIFFKRISIFHPNPNRRNSGVTENFWRRCKRNFKKNLKKNII